MTTVSDYGPKAHYDKVTAAWALLLGDDFHYGYFATGDEALPEATAALTRLMIEAVDLSPGLRLLDVGCGSGGPACDLVEQHGVEVLGISTSAVGVREARERARGRGLSGARFEERSGTDNGLPEESFDRVWVLEASHLMPERDALMDECVRVLRPGGRLALCDIVRRREIPFLELRSRKGEFATLRAAFGNARMDPLDDYVAMARERGLEVVEARDITAQTRPTFGHWRDNLDRHRDAVLPILGRQGVEDFESSLPILERFWDDGTLGYALFSAVKPA